MRRSIAAALVAMSAAASAALSLAPATASSATDGTARITVPANLPVALPPAGQATGTVAAQQARRALDHARQVLTGAAPAAASGSRPEATLAMRDLFAALPDLSPSDRRAAHSVLARPTDGSRDPYGDGYTVPAKRKCKGHFCIHWVPTTSDAPWRSTSRRSTPPSPDPMSSTLRPATACPRNMSSTSSGPPGERKPFPHMNCRASVKALLYCMSAPYDISARKASTVRCRQ